MVEPTTSLKSDFGFVTPVQFIAEMLVNLREKYFSSDDNPEFEQVRKNIKYSLEKLDNKQSLFQVDTDLTDQKKPSDEVSVASSMMDRLQDGLVNMLKKKNPDLNLKSPINNIITKQRRKTTVL